MMAKELSSPDDLGMAIQKALGLDDLAVRRIIVDCEATRWPMVYVELFGSTEMLQVDWAKGLVGAAIEVLDKQHARSLPEIAQEIAIKTGMTADEALDRFIGLIEENGTS